MTENIVTVEMIGGKPYMVMSPAFWDSDKLSKRLCFDNLMAVQECSFPD